MFVPFETLPDTARIWIFQSERKLQPNEIHTISESLKTFTNQWTAHNQTLGASFTILYDQFIVLAVNEQINQASGCSIDSSVRFLKTLSEQIGADFFDRNQVAFLINGTIHVIPRERLSTAISEGVWNEESVVFNNTIGSKGELEDNWKIKAGRSWLKRYLAKDTLSANK